MVTLTNALLVLIAGVGVFILLSLRKTSRHAAAPKAKAPLAQEQLLEIAEFHSKLADSLYPSDILVAGTETPGEFLLFGPKAEIAKQGVEILGQIPERTQRVALGSEALSKLATNFGEQQGVLVRLTKDSSQALRTLEPLQGPGSSSLAVLRDGTGKIRHIVQFSPATGLQALTSATGLISAVAMQAQLAAIENVIREVEKDVLRLDKAWTIHNQADLEAIQYVLAQQYALLQETGELSETMWLSVASLERDIVKHHRFAYRFAMSLVDELRDLSGPTEKNKWLEKNKRRIFETYTHLRVSEKLSDLYAVLLLQRLLETKDPNIRQYQKLIANRQVQQLEDRDRIDRELTNLPGKVATQSTFTKVVHPFSSREAARRAKSLQTEFARLGISPSPPDGTEYDETHLSIDEIDSDPEISS